MRAARILLALLLAGGAGPALAAGAAQAGSADADELARGRYLVHAGGCLSCHTAEHADAVPLAGGRALPTPFGTFYAPNITPDPDTGIGGWSVDDVVRALKRGRAPDGSLYYPAFPYPSYAGMSDGDARAIGAYLLSLPPAPSARATHELPWYLRWRPLVAAWNALNFDPQPFVPDPARDELWNRGAYLVRHLGHCGECHTPRTRLGGIDRERELAGNPAGIDGDPVPNITPHAGDGIGRWTRQDLELFLEIGMLPDGDFAGASMSAVIDDNTARLTPEDRQAIAAYLLSLDPLPAGQPAADAPPDG